MKIGIDVDLTLVDMDRVWKEFLDNKYGYRELPFRKRPYDFSVIYYDSPSEEFWNQSNLYDNVGIPAHRVPVVQQFQEQGHEIIFISNCYPNHYNSKVSMLERYFDDFIFIDSKAKHLVNVDVMIDDRNDILNKFPTKINLFRVDTDYEQVEPMKNNIRKIPDISWFMGKKLVEIVNTR